eukprot:1911276-Prymnesium_polylepis.4
MRDGQGTHVVHIDRHIRRNYQVWNAAERTACPHAEHHAPGTRDAAGALREASCARLRVTCTCSGRWPMLSPEA